MGPDPRGPCNDLARLAVFADARGRAIGALVTWACHPSARPVRDEVSSEFIGVARDALRRRLGPIPIVYLQGFSGDVRANVPMSVTPGRALIRLLKGPVFWRPTEPEWRAWATTVGESIGRLAEEDAMASSATLVGPILHQASRVSLDRILAGGPSDRCLEARHIRIGHALQLFFLSAEPAADHARRVEQALPEVWTVGYLGDVFGYFPTNSQIPQGGYEVDTFRELFSLAGRCIGRNDEALDELISKLRIPPEPTPSHDARQSGPRQEHASR